MMAVVPGIQFETPIWEWYEGTRRWHATPTIGYVNLFAFFYEAGEKKAYTIGSDK